MTKQRDGMFAEILSVLFRPITNEIGRLMATVEEIRDQLSTQITEVKTSLAEALDRVATDVESLKEQSDVPPETFDSVTQGLSEIKDSLDKLDPIADIPATEEPPAEEPPA